MLASIGALYLAAQHEGRQREAAWEQYEWRDQERHAERPRQELEERTE